MSAGGGPGTDPMGALEALGLLINQAMPCNWADRLEAAAWRQAQEVHARLLSANPHDRGIGGSTRSIWALAGQTSLAAMEHPDMPEAIPLVSNVPDQLDNLREHAERMAVQLREPVELVRYERAEVVEIFWPETGHG